MLVKDRMSVNPITALPETTHKQAVELMREHQINHLPIVDKSGRLVGIVVEEDLFHAQPTPATTLSIYEIHSLLSRLQLKEIMRHPVHTVAPDCPLEEAARMMIEENVGCLPVVDQDQIVGIITDTDVYQTFVGLLGSGREGARFTLKVVDQPGSLAKIAQAVADAGGNIISVVTWQNRFDEQVYITIKEFGADYRQLEQALDAMDVEVVDIREHPACEPTQYG
ncbi:CBS and ACT domain-containing protein [Aggregatilinea lenta]|uniref:CBS and ACT domain-containing protein n=1 Tax=Aggregatilinea lenta TaxID=913108 RepID=UPI000E5AEC79|nr:CBS and ACT domain-containing protein [Aggregatilinea lenta]